MLALTFNDAPIPDPTDLYHFPNSVGSKPLDRHKITSSLCVPLSSPLLINEVEVWLIKVNASLTLLEFLTIAGSCFGPMIRSRCT